MAPQKNKGRALVRSVAPKKIYKPQDFSGPAARCFLCASPIDVERGGYATFSGERLRGLLCFHCTDATRNSEIAFHVAARRMQAIDARLNAGEPVQFDGICVPSTRGRD